MIDFLINQLVKKIMKRITCTVEVMKKQMWFYLFIYSAELCQLWLFIPF